MPRASQHPQSEEGFVAVRGAGKICGFTPTDRCCCFELRTGMIILPAFLVIDMFVADILFWMQAEQNFNVIKDNERRTVEELKTVAAFHFLAYFCVTSIGLIGTIQYRAALVKPIIYFAPVSAMLTIIYTVVEVSMEAGLTYLQIYWAVVQACLNSGLDLWYCYCAWSLYWQLEAGIIRRDAEAAHRTSMSTTRYYQGGQRYSALDKEACEPVAEELEPADQMPQDPRLSFPTSTKLPDVV